MKILPKNWADFQHYKDRAPPWIKLHKTLLDNFDYQSLPVASRALAPMLWLLASEHEAGVIDATPEKLAFRLRMTETQVRDALKPLIDKEFFSVVDGDSAALADRKQGAMPETEAEKRERKDRRARDFQKFYAAYPKKKSPADAEKAFAKVDAPVENLLLAIERQAKAEDWQKENGRYIPHPASWLNSRAWEDGAEVTLPTKPVALFKGEAPLTPEQLETNRLRAAEAVAKVKAGITRGLTAHTNQGATA